MLKMNDWLEVLVHAKAEMKGMPEVTMNTYTMYNGEKGIQFNVFCMGDLFDTYYSGIWKTKEEYFSAIDSQIARIKQEVE